MSGSTRDQSKARHAGDYPSSQAHVEGDETKGPTPGHEDATDTNLAAKERGAHSQLPVEGPPESEQASQKRGS